MHVRKLCMVLDVAGDRDVLTTPEWCAYPPESIVVLDEEAAARDNMTNNIDCASSDC